MRLFVCYLAVVAIVGALESPQQTLVNGVKELKTMAASWLKETGEPFQPDPNYPYWNFLPTPLTQMLESQRPFQWKSSCFAENVASLSWAENRKSISVKIVSSGPAEGATHRECVDTYAVAFVALHNFFVITPAALKPVLTTEVVVTIEDDVTSAEMWDLTTHGLRLFSYPFRPNVVLSNLLVTIDLFTPEITGITTPRVLAMNKDMLEKYSHEHIFNPIEPGTLPTLDPNQVHSGDLFALLGFDGLGSMMSWAMGSTTSHTAVALWTPEGTLDICESTGDGVQCNPYEFFLNRYTTAQMVWVPLSESVRGRFNETAAWEWFRTVDGVAYGFHTLLWTWIDTQKDNFPCVPPDFASTCQTWQWSEIFMSLVDRHFHTIGWLVFNTGLAKRLGVDEHLRTAELLQIAAEQGYSQWTEVAIIPESDAWRYNTTNRDNQKVVSQDMVCCVFVCNMWKAAGIFDSELAANFNCGELTNWDDYVLTILDPNYTQILGNWTLVLNNYQSKDPYAHMGDTCPGLPPDYPRDPKC